MFILCIGVWTIWNKSQPSAEVVDDLRARNTQAETARKFREKLNIDVPPQFIYTKHALERMQERGANDNEVEETILTGEEVPAKNGKQKFEKIHHTSCVFEGKKYQQKKVEVVTTKKQDDWVIITVIADCE